MGRREVLRAIQADCDQAAAELDGSPFTGATMGRLFGEQLAMTKTLAEMVEHLMEEKDE